MNLRSPAVAANATAVGTGMGVVIGAVGMLVYINITASPVRAEAHDTTWVNLYNGQTHVQSDWDDGHGNAYFVGARSGSFVSNERFLVDVAQLTEMRKAWQLAHPDYVVVDVDMVSDDSHVRGMLIRYEELPHAGVIAAGN